jgi:hypothetical protein
MNREEEPIELRDFRTVYFDTSAWDCLSKDEDRERITEVMKRSRIVVLASVISAAEVLRTSDVERRRSTCAIMRKLHGEGPLLERHHELALAAAEAFIRGEKDITLPRTDSGRALYSHLLDPASPPNEDIRRWLQNMNDNLNRFVDQVKPNQPDSETRYCTPEVLEREDFLQILCELPPTKHLNLSTSQMRELCDGSDIWKALAATLGYMIELSTTHAPKSKLGKKRPGGPDLWQAVYVGVSEVFVTGDEGLLEAASRVSACLRYPRCVISREDFISGILRRGDEAVGTQDGATNNCRVCGCILPSHAGMHATPLQM